ncbi:RNA polymerase I-specific transcription initiation factor rrn3 [Hypsizygus marmoreus]|uniref:RNA polymerase I-specific transcription initiation factor rrn3 n=1 Tax=Hypsizygus marmoreus TaxID=39966 RepID=A0A369JEZ5_HYPMA|nr:RNA polymerase I-specific transcription initiation factor rrn3 [Hypsizygus marmoreus]
MDPHSRRSQFNQRTPRSGPKALNPRFVDLMAHPKPPVDSFSKPSHKKSQSTSVLVSRPIATNSRVKQDEKYRKDMYLAFVNNALQLKTIGTTQPFDELVNQFNYKSQPSQGVPQLAQLRLWISALSHVVSRLERTHSALVHAVVNMPWTTLDSATVKSYTVFIGMLISARPEYLSLVLGKIAQGFTHQSGIQALDAGLPEGSSSPLTRRVIYDRLHDLLRHLLSLIPTLPSTLQPLLVRNFPHKRQNQVAQTTYIRNLLRVSVYCPELADKILATIVDRAIQIDVEIQVELEELEEVDEPVQEDVFELDPFDTLVGQEGDDSDSENGDDDDGDNLSDISSAAGDMDDEAKAPEVPTNVTYIQDMVKKLDAILTLIFDHFHRNHTSITTSGTLQLPPPLPDLPPLDLLSPPFMSSPIQSPRTISLSSLPSLQPSGLVSAEYIPPTPPSATPTPSTSPSAETRKALLRTQFHTLLAIFDRTILRTFKSRYTQFLVFWYTSLDPEFADIFQGMLVERALFDTTAAHAVIPVVTRAAAASYIGSFVSRATFVDREGARQVVGVLCDFLTAHLDGYSAGATAQNTVFYAVAQAVFLIFCFRWRDLLEEKEDGDDELLIGSADKGGKKWMPKLSILQRVVRSSLNPLRACSVNVVNQFAHVAHATDFIYCYTILESNKRSEYGPSSTADARGGQVNPSALQASRSSIVLHPELNTFFPFDPYRLPKSNVYIQDVYREWSSVAIDEEDEDEDDEDEDEEDEDSEEGGGDGDGKSEDPALSGFLSIPRSDAAKGNTDDLGLGESLEAMSISPMHSSMSVQMQIVG